MAQKAVCVCVLVCLQIKSVMRIFVKGAADLTGKPAPTKKRNIYANYPADEKTRPNPRPRTVKGSRCAQDKTRLPLF